MKKLLILTLAVCVVCSVVAVAQDTMSKSCDTGKAAAAPLKTLKGTVKADGDKITFVNDADQTVKLQQRILQRRGGQENLGEAGNGAFMEGAAAMQSRNRLTPREVEVATSAGHSVRNVLVGAWLPIELNMGTDLPGTGQNRGPNTVLMFCPDCCRSP